MTLLSLTVLQWWWVDLVLLVVLAGVWVWSRPDTFDPTVGWEPTAGQDFLDPNYEPPEYGMVEDDEVDPWDAVLYEKR